MDNIIKETLKKELNRQQNNIELIASENFVSKEILELQGSILTNKYAEGYPNRRYDGGCEFVDIIENRAIELAKELFGCKFANVQPHSGSSANMAVYKALLKTNDKVLGMNLDHGGHLTHGHKVNFSGIEYEIISYDVDKITGEIDYEKLEKIAIEEKPKMIIAGASAYSRKIDFARFRKIADINNSYLMVDMAHIAGLVATDLHQNPVMYADVVTSTTHKTLRGPRGGLILTNNEEIAKKIDKTIFPGIQGGPLMHVIAAKAQCFYEASQPSFKKYMEQVVSNCKILSDSLKELGISVVADGTDNHLLLVNVLESFEMDGHDAEVLLETINITCNKNMIPYDTLSAKRTSGIRLGTAAMTTRGLTGTDFKEIAQIIYLALSKKENLETLKERVKVITDKYPLYGEF